MQKIIFGSLILWLIASAAFGASSLSSSFVSDPSGGTTPSLTAPRTCSVILEKNISTGNYTIEDDTGNSFRALVQSIKIEHDGSSGRSKGSQIVFKMHPLACVQMEIDQRVNYIGIKEELIDPIKQNKDYIIILAVEYIFTFLHKKGLVGSDKEVLPLQFRTVEGTPIQKFDWIQTSQDSKSKPFDIQDKDQIATWIRIAKQGTISYAYAYLEASELVIFFNPSVTDFTPYQVAIDELTAKLI